jgi:hypothetical protein
MINSDKESLFSKERPSKKNRKEFFFKFPIKNFKKGNFKKEPPFLLSCRFLLSFSVFLGAAIQYMQKIDMSITIVSMINNTAIKVDRPPLNYFQVKSTNQSNDTCLFKPVNSTHSVSLRVCR